MDKIACGGFLLGEGLEQTFNDDEQPILSAVGEVPSPTEDGNILVSDDGEWKESNKWNLSDDAYDLSISVDGISIKHSDTQQPIIEIDNNGVYFLCSNGSDAIKITGVNNIPIIQFLGNHAGGVLYVDATDAENPKLMYNDKEVMLKEDSVEQG